MVEYDSFSAWLAAYDNSILTNLSLFLDIFTYFILALFLLYLAFIKKDRKKAAVILVTYICLILLIPTLKFAFSEVRPCSAPWKIQCPSDYSLPSGHAAAVAVILIAYLTTRLFPYALLAYVVVSLSRIYLGVHVFKDIIAGTSLAFAIFLIVEALLSKSLGNYFSQSEEDKRTQRKRWLVESKK